MLPELAIHGSILESLNPTALHRLTSGLSRQGKHGLDLFSGGSHGKRKINDVSHYIETKDAGRFHHRACSF